MSIRATGVRDLDGHFAKMLDVKLACDAAAIDYPKEIADYFGEWVHNDEKDLRRFMAYVEIGGAVKKIASVDCDCIEIDLLKLPNGVKSIVVNCCY